MKTGNTQKLRIYENKKFSNSQTSGDKVKFAHFGASKTGNFEGFQIYKTTESSPTLAYKGGF